ncbi:MAG: hypothetical protein V4549_07515 [Bacteroidota bacterium]
MNWIKTEKELPNHKDLVIFVTEYGAILPAIYYNNSSFKGFYPFTNFYQTYTNNFYFNVPLGNEFKNVVNWILVPNPPKKLEVGTILIAIDECIMDDSILKKEIKALIIGKEYKVLGFDEDNDNNSFYIISELYGHHYFNIDPVEGNEKSGYKYYFKIKE